MAMTLSAGTLVVIEYGAIVVVSATIGSLVVANGITVDVTVTIGTSVVVVVDCGVAVVLRSMTQGHNCGGALVISIGLRLTVHGERVVVDKRNLSIGSLIHRGSSTSAGGWSGIGIASKCM